MVAQIAVWYAMCTALLVSDPMSRDVLCESASALSRFVATMGVRVSRAALSMLVRCTLRTHRRMKCLRGESEWIIL